MERQLRARSSPSPEMENDRRRRFVYTATALESSAGAPTAHFLWNEMSTCAKKPSPAPVPVDAADGELDGSRCMLLVCEATVGTGHRKGKRSRHACALGSVRHKHTRRRVPGSINNAHE